MNICVLLVITLVPLVCKAGEPSTPSNDIAIVDEATQTEIPVDSMGYCIFEDFPSASCMFNCFLKGLSASCDSQGWCFCTPEGEDKTDTLNHPLSYGLPSSSDPKEDAVDDEEEGMTIFIFDFGPLLEEDDDTEARPEIPPSIFASTHSAAWTLPHMLAVLILLLLTVLVTLEVRSCCQQRNKKQLSVQSVLYPPEYDNPKSQVG